MAFKIVFSDEALSELNGLDNPNADRVLRKLAAAAGNPDHFFERLVGREDYRMRVGDYRIIAKVLRNEETIHVLSVGHRKNVYKKLKTK